MVKVLQRNISIFPTFQCYLENSASLNDRFPFFQKKISTDPIPVGTDFVACVVIKYNEFQISGSKSDETPYLMP